MSSSSSDSSSLDNHSSGSSSGSSNGRSSVSEASLLGKVGVALEAKDGVEVGSSISPHDLGFTFLKVKSLGVKRLA